MQGILSWTWRMGEKTDQDRHQCQWDEYVQAAQVKKGHEVTRKKKKTMIKGSLLFFKEGGEWGQGMDRMVCREPPKNLLENVLGIKEL